jgi:rhodanese-related sulfurtransferase
MGTHANKGGRAAGANAAGGDETFRGAYHTAIVKIFDYTLARTGMNHRALKAGNVSYESTFIIAPATPGFYPEPKDIFMQIYYGKHDKKLLGAEVFGEKGVDKRIDVLSTAIYAKLSVADLHALDLAYAPPFSPAKDPVVVAGFVSESKQKHQLTEVDAAWLRETIARKPADEYQLIDVRTAREVDTLGSIGHAVNIAVDDLREQLTQLDKQKPTIVYCAKGLRGYIASMILIHAGFARVCNLGGGFTSWSKAGYEANSAIQHMHNVPS